MSAIVGQGFNRWFYFLLNLLLLVQWDLSKIICFLFQ
uniref:Uncharacterized protein n=1 Tax=Anguilla anguilla TaxID=7936 RepID=A0A0E9Y2A2_ANGAN